MKKQKILAVVLGATVLMSACGGGGGKDAIPNPVAAITNNDIESVFRLGVLATDLVDSYEAAKLPFFVGFLVRISNQLETSSPITSFPCDISGTVTTSLNKTGVYRGMNANDSATFSFSDCKFNGLSATYNGNASLVSINGARNLDSTGVNLSNLQFSLNSAELSLTSGSVRVVHNGAVNATFNSTLTSTGIDVTTTTEYSWAFIPTTAATATILTTASPGSRLAATSTNSNAFTLFYSGTLTANAGDGPTFLEITTPMTIAGTRNSTSGALIPTAGAMNVRAAQIDISTLGTFSQRSLSISGDSDRNGTLDRTFTTLY